MLGVVAIVRHAFLCRRGIDLAGASAGFFRQAEFFCRLFHKGRGETVHGRLFLVFLQLSGVTVRRQAMGQIHHKAGIAAIGSASDLARLHHRDLVLGTQLF